MFLQDEQNIIKWLSQYGALPKLQVSKLLQVPEVAEEKILKNLAQSSIRNVIGSYDVDSVLTTGKNEIQASIREALNAQLQKHDIGLVLVNVTIQDSEPPTAEIMEAFKKTSPSSSFV